MYATHSRRNGKANMIYNEKQRERLLRLYRRLKQIGFRFWNTEDGMGQTAIFTTDYSYVSDSEYWVHDFVENKLTSRHIVKALQTPETTPYQFADITTATKSPKRRRKPLRPEQTDDSQQAKDTNTRRDKEQP
jgi:hypothetical protein